MIHELKVVEPYLDALLDGSKTFEVRRNDRGFQCGDTLWLREYRPAPPYQRYTGREVRARITYVYSGDPRFGDWPSGLVVLGLAKEEQ